MRLLFLSSSFPNAFSATRGTFNLSLWRAVAAEHQVRVVSPVSWIDELSHLKRGRTLGLRTRQFTPSFVASYPRFVYPPRCLRNWYGSFLWWSIGGELKREIKEFRPDAIVSYWAHPDGEAALRAAQWAKIPAIAMVGGSDVLLLGRAGSRRRVIMNVLNQADAVVPVSQNIAEALLADGIPADKIHVIPRGVDRGLFHPGDQQAARTKLGLPLDRPLLTTVGRLVPVKGFDTLIDAVKLLKARVPNVLCCIVGGGELHAALDAQIQRHNLREHVRLVGARGQTELADWYRAADLTVLTSHSEGIPNVLLESLCCGTPFVATRVGGVPAIADERFHSLVPPADPSALAAALEARLLSLPADRTRQALTVLKFVPPSWESSAHELCELIQNLRSARASSRNNGEPSNSHSGGRGSRRAEMDERALESTLTTANSP